MMSPSWHRSFGSVSSLCRRPYMCNISGSTHDTDQQCMDVVDTVRCWTPEHMAFVLPPLIMLPPYYIIAMHLKMAAQVPRAHARHVVHESIIACA